MNAQPKDLNYYLNHPDEMPTDSKLIEQLAEDMRNATMASGQDEVSVDRFMTTNPVAKDERTGTSSDAEAKPEEKVEKKAEEKVEPEAKAEPTETKPEGILAKDGKNIIPFAVLSNARERAEAAERLVAEQAAELNRLKAGAGVTTAQQDTQILSDDELNALAEDSPTLAKVLRAQQNTIQNLTGTVNSLAQTQQAQFATQEAEAKSEVQIAIDSNQTLTAWQNAEDQTMWDEASKFDKLLRETPRYKDTPFEERFKKVVELTQSALGIETESKTEQNAPSQADIKAAAEAKLKETKTLPTSHSQIPGGTSPSVDEKDRVEQMSSVELGQKFLGMSREQMDTYLATL